jgi:hypothetical protein
MTNTWYQAAQAHRPGAQEHNVRQRRYLWMSASTGTDRQDLAGILVKARAMHPVKARMIHLVKTRTIHPGKARTIVRA